MPTEAGWAAEWREYIRCFPDFFGDTTFNAWFDVEDFDRTCDELETSLTRLPRLVNDSDDQLSKPTTVFHKFNLLPAELRIKIWKHAYPDIRTGIIELHYSLFATKYATNFAALPTQVLPIMLSCREAFSVMDRHYFPQNEIVMDIKKSILYLNSDINHWGSLTQNLSSKITVQIETVAVNVSVWIDSYAAQLVQDLRKFPNLKALYLLRQDGQAWNWGSYIRLGEKDTGSKICEIARAVLNAEMVPFPELNGVRASGFDVYFVDRSQ